MLFLKKPVEEKINSILLSQKKKALSYPHVKGTLEHSSSESFRNDERFSRNYFIDHYRVKIGRGNDIFRKAIDGLRSWKQFSLDWVDLFYPDTPLQEGNDVVLVANTCGVWTVSAVRVVYVIEENQMDISPWKRFGFANGTLEDHVETGEERFLLEWNTETDDVFYDILSFSRQNSWFTKFAFPVARYFQKCFADDSSKAMMDWIENGQEARKNGVSIV